MSSTPATSKAQTDQSSGSEETPDSGTSRTKRAYTKLSNSPTLQAFDTFDESLAKFVFNVQTKIDHVGANSVDLLRTELGRMRDKCDSMRKDFNNFISLLDWARGIVQPNTHIYLQQSSATHNIHNIEH